MPNYGTEGQRFESSRARRKPRSDDALEILWADLFDLPTIDLSLHVKLPELITPELHRLRDAVADDDPDRGWDELRAVTDQIDTPTNAPDSPTRSCASPPNTA